MDEATIGGNVLNLQDMEKTIGDGKKLLMKGRT